MAVDSLGDGPTDEGDADEGVGRGEDAGAVGVGTGGLSQAQP